MVATAARLRAQRQEVSHWIGLPSEQLQLQPLLRGHAVELQRRFIAQRCEDFSEPVLVRPFWH